MNRRVNKKKKVNKKRSNPNISRRNNTKVANKSTVKRGNTKTRARSSTKGKKQKRKNKKIRIVCPLIVLVFGFLVGTYIYSNHTEEAKTVKKYYELLSQKKYEEMYDLVYTDLEKEDFVNRIKNIYDGIEANGISVRVLSNSKAKDASDQDINITYKYSMSTIAGNVDNKNTIPVTKKNNEYKIKWNSSMIFNNLNDNEKIRVRILKSSRGNILDRNGFALAKNSTVYDVGVIPSKLDKENISSIANLLEMNEKTIKKDLDSYNAKENDYISLKRMSREEQQVKNELLKIKGIIIGDSDARVYPYKEATSILTGYLQDGDGKAGLELTYNDTLKGKNGAEIYIDLDGKIKEVIARTDPVDGKDIKLTIDANIQQKIYDEFSDDCGTTVEINYNTGEILALVSTPTYDSNVFSLGITEDEWNKMQNDENKPMFNRYLATYTPGSTIKPLMGAIGLTNEIIKEDEDLGKSVLKWQKDSSWKDFYITTLESYDEPVNLESALVYSDNVYFAKLALELGKNNIEKGLNNFGFNSKIEFEQELDVSEYGKLDNDKTIATTGFGQANVMVNPILMASIYSSFANNGNMVKPYLLYEENDEERVKLYKENAISSEVANTIKEYLIEVVERGSGKKCYIEEKTIAGKTGTAEIKKDQKDINGTENGWFNSFDENGNLFISMVENVKSKGGSSYVVEKMKNIYENLDKNNQ